MLFRSEGNGNDRWVTGGSSDGRWEMEAGLGRRAALTDRPVFRPGRPFSMNDDRVQMSENASPPPCLQPAGVHGGSPIRERSDHGPDLGSDNIKLYYIDPICSLVNNE